jgi:hypothetical protein
VDANADMDIHLRELGLSDATFFSPDEEPARIANIIAEYFRSSLLGRFSMQARTSFRWEAIYPPVYCSDLVNDG